MDTGLAHEVEAYVRDEALRNIQGLGAAWIRGLYGVLDEVRERDGHEAAEEARRQIAVS